MAFDKKIRELRLLYGTTFNTSFTAADNAIWTDGTAIKIRAIDWEDNMEHMSEADPTLESQTDRHRARIPTLRQGNCSFKTFIEGGSSTTTANPIATLLSKFFGGLASPSTTKADALDNSGTHTTVKLYASGVEGYVAPGQAVLVGARGDTRGEGEVRLIPGEGTDYIDLGMATADTPIDTDAIVYSHTVYLAPSATQNYVDGLVIGEDETTPDQKQWIGGMGNVSLEALNVGELGPIAKFDIGFGDWQFVASDDKAALTPGTAHVGNAPPIDRGLGGCFIQAVGTTTRARSDIAGLSITPNLNYVKRPSPGGVNGINGWKRVRGEGVKFEFDILREQGASTLSLYTKFLNGTALHLMFQWGHEAEKCFAISIPRGFIDSIKESEVEGLSSWKITGHATTGTNDNELLDSAMALHFF